MNIVNPRPRSIPMTVINKTLKSRILSIVKRVRRLTQSTVSNTKTAPLNVKQIQFQTTSMTKCEHCSLVSALISD